MELLSDRYSHLPTQRSLYVEDPGAAAFLVRLALDMGDTNLKHSVLETVDRLAGDNPGISIIKLSAMHANALANGDPAALESIIKQSPDPFSVALATEELAKHSNEKAPAASSGGAHEGCAFSDMERRIAYLVSVGMTNRQIAKRVHLSAHTVNYHLRKVYRRLGINTRAELARRAATFSKGHEIH
jgi:DNA-binding CsgD family transcriptional regulator